MEALKGGQNMTEGLESKCDTMEYKIQDRSLMCAEYFKNNLTPLPCTVHQKTIQKHTRSIYNLASLWAKKPHWN